MLTHELNNYTMSEAIKEYPLMKAAFKVRSIVIPVHSININLLLQYLVPVGVAYNITHPYVEQNYTLPTFSQC